MQKIGQNNVNQKVAQYIFFNCQGVFSTPSENDGQNQAIYSQNCKERDSYSRRQHQSHIQARFMHLWLCPCVCINKQMTYAPTCMLVNAQTLSQLITCNQGHICTSMNAQCMSCWQCLYMYNFCWFFKLRSLQTSGAQVSVSKFVLKQVMDS